jgi:ABC-type Mn2+/Zn2+ transport system ATPase subunit
MILRDLDLEIERGSFVSIIGHNGSGKTTLLKLILGVLKPSSGMIRIFPQEGDSSPPSVGYINQGCVDTRLPVSVSEVVEIGLLGRKAEQGKAVRNALRLVGIEELASRPYRALSGGQKQKVQIARCLARESRLFLLDEPTSFLDESSELDFMDILKRINGAQNITIIMISHDRSIVERCSDRIIRLDQGALREGARP